MRISKIMFVCICLVGLIQPAWSQNANKTSHGIPGYLDPQTGAFTPVVQSAVEGQNIANIAASAGKFVATFTITIGSPIPTTDVILCTFTADVFEAGHAFDESATVTATRHGSTATCTVTMAYSWPLSTPTSDLVNLGYSITAGASTSSVALSRVSTHTIGTIKVPGIGSTTDETILATI